MKIEVVNERRGWGYDENGEPLIRIDGVWRRATGAHLHGSTLVVSYRLHARRDEIAEYGLSDSNWCKRL